MEGWVWLVNCDMGAYLGFNGYELGLRGLGVESRQSGEGFESEQNLLVNGKGGKSCFGRDCYVSHRENGKDADASMNKGRIERSK